VKFLSDSSHPDILIPDVIPAFIKVLGK